MGGHEWVLLFYPDGKRSSSSEAGLGGGVGAVVVPPPGPGNFEGAHPLPCVSSGLVSPHGITFHIAGGLAPGIRLFSTIYCLMKHLPGGCCRMQGHHKLSVKLLLQRLPDIEGRALH